MKNVRLIHGATNKVRLAPDASLSLLAGNGKDVLFFLLHRASMEKIVINDCIDGKWGEEIQFILPPGSDDPERHDVFFTLGPKGMSVWNSVYSAVFDRFEPALADQVRFMRLRPGAEMIHDRMTFATEPLDATLVRIEAHILHRRMDALEAQLQGADGNG